MKLGAIRVRLTFWYSMVLLCGLILFGGGVWLAMYHQTIADVDSALANRAQGLEEYLRIEEAEDVNTLRHELSELNSSLPSNYELEILGPDGHSLFASGHADTLFKEARLRSTTSVDSQQQIIWQGKHYRARTHSIDIGASEYRIIVAANIEEALHTDAQLGFLLLAAIPLVVLVAAFGGYFISARALAPVSAMTNAARQIGIEDLSRRLPVSNAGDEIQQLAETWNNMLARLEIAVTRMSEFTSDASHELRTPIALIRSTAEIALRRTRPEPQYRDALVQIQVESERMTQLVSDLLFLARADDEAVSAEMTGLDLRAPVREACEEIAPLAVAQDKELELQDNPECLPLIGHASSLRRMLLAILENAIKYTAPGGKITIDMNRAGGALRLTVRDTGIGIPASALPHIFERFFRADPSRNRSSGGYGLGLAIAQTIARQHRGSIEVQSRVGGGSAFCVTLPRYADAEISNDSRAAFTVLAKSSSE